LGTERSAAIAPDRDQIRGNNVQLKIQKSNETVRGAFASTATARLFSLVGALFMLSITFPAHAALTRVGPVSNAPSIGGYPTWYQDNTGLTLEFCASDRQKLEPGVEVCALRGALGN
jgi:hypothetical protein